MLASLGCGNPTAVAELREGDVVLDLGSGGGIDVLLSAKRVGPSGQGVRPGHDGRDARRSPGRTPAKAEATNVEFLKGYIEDIPLPDASVDVDHLELRHQPVHGQAEGRRSRCSACSGPNGRLGISDVVAANELAPSERAERGSFVGCIAGALSFDEYTDELSRAGFTDIRIEPTHELTEQMFGAIVRAREGPER